MGGRDHTNTVRRRDESVVQRLHAAQRRQAARRADTGRDSHHAKHGLRHREPRHESSARTRRTSRSLKAIAASVPSAVTLFCTDEKYEVTNKMDRSAKCILQQMAQPRVKSGLSIKWLEQLDVQNSESSLTTDHNNKREARGPAARFAQQQDLGQQVWQA